MSEWFHNITAWEMSGGQFMDQFVKSRKKMHKISMISCGVVILLMFSLGMTMGLFFFAYFAYQNYMGYKEARY